MHRLSCWFFFICVLIQMGTERAAAHPLDMTGVKVVLGTNQVAVSVRAHAHDLVPASATAPSGAGTVANVATAGLESELLRRLKLRVDGEPFRPGTGRVGLDTANGLVLWQASQPGTGLSATLEAPLVPEKTGAYTVLSVYCGGKLVGETLLRSGESTASAPPASRGVAGRFLVEGVRHIFLGPDHILFLVSLLLLGGGWRQLLKVTAAFTLAHSITLSLAATGVLNLPGRLVEPVIALSIVAVAGANLLELSRREEGPPRATSGDWRPWLAFGFGLVHGFGFAGALAELGLPRDALAAALLAFNGGVELGQVFIVLALAPLLAWGVRGRPGLEKGLVAGGSFGVAAMGSLWFAERLFAV